MTHPVSGRRRNDLFPITGLPFIGNLGSPSAAGLVGIGAAGQLVNAVARAARACGPVVDRGLTGNAEKERSTSLDWFSGGIAIS
ncbi:hypothetical protein N9E47_07045 [Luminiphilus sp.]|nr:hypothetical protein [Luminiphilus sp.]